MKSPILVESADMFSVPEDTTLLNTLADDQHHYRDYPQHVKAI